MHKLQGTLFSEKDSSRVDSALVILYDLDDYEEYYDDNGVYDTGKPKKIFAYAQTDSAGKFVFKNLAMPGNDTSEVKLAIEVYGADVYHYTSYIVGHKDSLNELEFYISPYGYEREYNPPSVSPPTSYEDYVSLTLSLGSLFDKKGYRWNYKMGFSIAHYYRITPINYLAWEITPFIYRRYTTKNDTVNTRQIFSKEYYASVQSGFAISLRTHLFSWSRKENALFADAGVEYNCPWHYWYIGKQDEISKLTSKNFHKYNELYLNAKIGIIKGVSIKGQYRLTDIFKSAYEELPHWSVELQAVFLLF